MIRIIQGDALEQLRTLPAESAHCCVTSPPYWGLRDYGVPGQLGLERTPEEYVARMVEVFREVRRVLREDGTLWLNMGDNYAGSWGAQGRNGQMADRSVISARQIENHPKFKSKTGMRGLDEGLKPKNLIGIPWRLAFALQADGWWLRSDIIWAKPNPMPESVTDRPTKAHEYVFLLSKAERYYYDAEAIREQAICNRKRGTHGYSQVPGGGNHAGLSRFENNNIRNTRSVWWIVTTSFNCAHFATFPEELARRCILAGCPAGGTVLDPFAGAGTTGLVADKNNRNAVLIELNPEYCEMARRRIVDSAPMLAQVEAAGQRPGREA